MIRSTVRPDRRRKPAPVWEPPRDSSPLDRIIKVTKLATTFKESTK